MLESRSAYGYYGSEGGYTGERNPNNYRSTRMTYREYKTRWSDHKTVRGSYNEKDKTIEVIFTEEEMKAKTNLGNRYQLETFYFRFSNVLFGISPVMSFRAKNYANAERNAKAFARYEGYKFEGEAKRK